MDGAGRLEPLDFTLTAPLLEIVQQSSLNRFNSRRNHCMAAAQATRADSILTRTECPYCRKPLRWVAMRWLARGVFECDRCGEFPDFRHPLRDRSSSAEFAPIDV